MYNEKIVKPRSGWGALTLLLLGLIGPAIALTWAIANADRWGAPGAPLAIIGCLSLIVVDIVLLCGLKAVGPNEARVMTLFGVYQGSIIESGFYWVNPFYSCKTISLKVRNFETGSTTSPEQKDGAGKVIQVKTRSHGRPSKVNDRDGNPVEISAVVVWKVVDTAEASFEVDDYEDFVAVQSEAALRSMASRYPYDSEDHEVSLRGSTMEISQQLQADIQERLHKAGVKVLEARVSHLAYASEIAAAMLQRQQAQAVVAARTKIVEGAVSMVEAALDQLSGKKIVELDDERRAAMVSNLLVVLCSDRHTQPVVNAGSIYH
jgi:regulator of protease activity HflC (stomatin/prohibitin superfamily)